MTATDHIAALADRVAALQASGTGERVILGIVGEPGAGKSTVAVALVGELTQRGRRAALVPMDGFHLANSALARLGLLDRKGAPETFDGYGYLALLRRLRARVPGEVVYAPIYERAIEESVGSALPVGDDIEVVVTEGNYLLLAADPWPAVAAELDQSWFIEVDPSVRIERLVARHVEFGKAPEAATAWVYQVDEGNAALVRGSRHRADLIVTWS